MNPLPCVGEIRASSSFHLQRYRLLPRRLKHHLLRILNQGPHRRFQRPLVLHHKVMPCLMLHLRCIRFSLQFLHVQSRSSNLPLLHFLRRLQCFHSRIKVIHRKSSPIYETRRISREGGWCLCDDVWKAPYHRHMHRFEVGRGVWTQ